MMRRLDGLILPTSQEFKIALETGIRLNRLFQRESPRNQLLYLYERLDYERKDGIGMILMLYSTKLILECLGV